MLIPPSLLMILYGFLSNQSVGDLFTAGIVPGLLLALAYIAGHRRDVLRLAALGVRQAARRSKPLTRHGADARWVRCCASSCPAC
jgi:TRAP-type C4-dicarboxylate transport system permease large subunit